MFVGEERRTWQDGLVRVLAETGAGVDIRALRGASEEGGGRGERGLSLECYYKNY